MSEFERPKRVAVFEGKARVGEVFKNFVHLQLRPEDFSSPLSLQMALTRVYEGLMRALSEGPKKSYVAEVRFVDSLGQSVVIGVDLGPSPPPFSSNTVKARVVIELFEEE